MEWLSTLIEDATDCKVRLVPARWPCPFPPKGWELSFFYQVLLSSIKDMACMTHKAVGRNDVAGLSTGQRSRSVIELIFAISQMKKGKSQAKNADQRHPAGPETLVRCFLLHLLYANDTRPSRFLFPLICGRTDSIASGRIAARTESSRHYREKGIQL